MKLGEIKLMALKLMFADTDITYDLADMQEYYNNGNTRDKLLRMNDSINRALSLYYQRVGLPQAKKEVQLDAEGGTSVYFLNEIEDLPAQITDLHNVLKVRISSDYSRTVHNASFEFDGSDMVFSDLRRYMTAEEKEAMKIEVFYEKKPQYLITSLGEITPSSQDIALDFDDLGIPTEIQLAIPLYVKGEAYEEDEPQMALYAKNEYLNYLQLVKKPKIIKQQRVKSINWNK